MLAIECPNCGEPQVIEVVVRDCYDLPDLNWKGLEDRYHESIEASSMEHDDDGDDYHSNWYAHGRLSEEDELTECLIRRGRDNSYQRLGLATSDSSTSALLARCDRQPTPGSKPKHKAGMSRSGRVRGKRKKETVHRSTWGKKMTLDWYS